MSQQAKMFEIQTTQTRRLDYLLSLPEGYGDDDRPWPLMLFLHGSGERAGTPDGLNAVYKHGLPKRLQHKNDLPFVVVSPQCPKNEWWSMHLDTLMALLDDTLANYAIDSTRVYLTGLSMGGFGAWHLAYLHSERFAAVAPICGGMPWFIDENEGARVLKDMPLWVFHGAKDETVPVQFSEAMVNALNKVGGNVKFTVYPDLGHNSWTVTYDNPELYAWFLQHQVRQP